MCSLCKNKISLKCSSKVNNPGSRAPAPGGSATLQHSASQFMPRPLFRGTIGRACTNRPYMNNQKQ